MTQEEITAQRNALITEAMSWEGTRFHHRAAVKKNEKQKGGVDCMMFPASTFTAALGAKFLIPPYSPQWHLHAEPKDSPIFRDFPAFVPRGELWKSGEVGFRELYIEGVLTGGFVEISGGRTGIEPFDSGRFIDAKIERADLVLVRLGHVYAHGAIIVDWPRIIQSESSPMGAGRVVLSNAQANWFFAHRKVKFFSWEAWH